MDECVRCQWLKEEVFLAEHYESADAVVARIGERWRPNYTCDDGLRRWREMLVARGRLDEYVFDSAVMFCGREGLSSIRIYLRSSSRFLVT